MYKVKRFIRKIIRIFEYLPILWKTADHDYGYNIELFKYQLQRTAAYMQLHGHTEDAQLNATKITAAVGLIDRGYLGKYIDEAEISFERQYGQPDITFDETDGMYNMRMYWPTAADSDHNDQINEFYQAQMTAAYNKADNAKGQLWKYISENIETWWD